MDVLEQMAAWIKSYPQWGDTELTIDNTAPKPGCCGLFPLGEEEIARQEDVLGNIRIRYRRTFALRRVAQRGENAARWMLTFGRWARTSTPPALGERTVAKAARGRLLTSVATGIATYDITISLEYTEDYHEN